MQSLLLFFFFIPISYCLICPKEYILVNDQKCLKISWAAATHWEAETNCTAASGTLVNIKNAIDNRAVVNFASNAGLKTIWLGLSCFGNTTSSCFWDDASGNPIYENFNSYSPPGYYGSCASMFISSDYGTSQGKWSSTGCNNVDSMMSAKQPYICETPPTIETTFMSPCPFNYNGYCYVKSQDIYMSSFPSANGTQASAYCSRPQFSNLASVHSKMELDFIRNIYKGTNTTAIYIGAQAAATDEFNWLDGSKWDFDYMDPLNFNKGKCLVMDVQGDGLWSQVDCTQKMEYLCKQKLVAPVTPAPTKSSLEKKNPENLLDASNCNSTLFLAPGEISSFGYPDYSSPPTYCTWRLVTLGPYRLGIFFDFWATYGALNIYDEFGANIGQFLSPYSRKPFVRYTPYNIATVTFEPKSGGAGSEVDEGFHATVLPVS
ncbi:hypothetical protein CRE_14634 [Caenorhabditis remanei]|uniref:C-type LECtin n=1 Tax=Caenorhabditis remanei TaxID=31234 RepID=E3M983_CAERE|nr:hypothetical protein CRE_14634 [Caenorhabditis remanei]